MYINLHPSLAADTAAVDAARLATACVHCGFCLATCPTYLDNRDERDSPRGRIYLIKELLETGEGAGVAQHHLDRCLTCRSCETTCPSGVEYAAIADAGRAVSDRLSPRSRTTAFLRLALRVGISRPALFRIALRVGQLLRPLMPAALAGQLPRRQRVRRAPARSHTRKMLLLEGCVQAAATPATNAAARLLFDRLGIELVAPAAAGCCGAVNHHLGAHGAALAAMRRNIDAWWPHIEAGAEAIVSCATGCGVQLVDYGRLLATDPIYAARAARVSALAQDVAQVLAGENLASLAIAPAKERIAVHSPCTQVHGLQQGQLVPEILDRLGFTLVSTRDDHLCCGSAGTYSLLQADTSKRLRRRKLDALCSDAPDRIVTANVGCQLHLDAASAQPVQHWLQLLADTLPAPQAARTGAGNAFPPDAR